MTDSIKQELEDCTSDDENVFHIKEEEAACSSEESTSEDVNEVCIKQEAVDIEFEYIDVKEEIDPATDVGDVIDNGLEVPFETFHLIQRNQEDARKLLLKHYVLPGKTTLKNEQLLNLITQLLAVALQVIRVLNGEPSEREIAVLDDSLEEIYSSLSVNNQQIFQNRVEIQMQHLRMEASDYILS